MYNVDEDHLLTGIVETYNIIKKASDTTILTKDVELESEVSMSMLGLYLNFTIS